MSTEPWITNPRLLWLRRICVGVAGTAALALVIVKYFSGGAPLEYNHGWGDWIYEATAGEAVFVVALTVLGLSFLRR